MFWAYWRFAAERLRILIARLEGRPSPWTHDEVLAQHRFTNAYRFSDRVSQFLISHVVGDEATSVQDAIFRILLFRTFNRIEIWQTLCSELGEPGSERFDYDAAAALLDGIVDSGGRLYSAAYIVPPVRSHRGPGAPKHQGHLAWLESVVVPKLPMIARADSMQSAFQAFRQLPGIGSFLAYQYAVDLGYGHAVRLSEDEFVEAGPGAREGIRRCFEEDVSGGDALIIAHAAAHQDRFFAEVEEEFPRLGGRPLQLIDCQNLFCEVAKYARVAFPASSRPGDRTRIKQRYATDPTPLPPLRWPPGWAPPTEPLPGMRCSDLRS